MRGNGKRATIVLDPEIAYDEIHVGGALVLCNPSLEEIGWLAGGAIVRVSNHVVASGVEVAAPDVAFRRFDVVTCSFISPGVV